MTADLTTAFRTRLLGDADLVRRLATAESVYPDLVPASDPLPALRYELLSDRPYQTLAGPSVARVARVQYDALARTRAEADAIARDVARLLGNLVAVIPETRLADSPRVAVEESTEDNRYARLDPPPPGSAEPTYRTVVDFVVTYRHEPLAPEA